MFDDLNNSFPAEVETAFWETVKDFCGDKDQALVAACYRSLSVVCCSGLARAGQSKSPANAPTLTGPKP